MNSHEALEIGMIHAHAQYDISPSFSTPLDHGDITERRFQCRGGRIVPIHQPKLDRRTVQVSQHSIPKTIHALLGVRGYEVGVWQTKVLNDLDGRPALILVTSVGLGQHDEHFDVQALAYLT